MEIEMLRGPDRVRKRPAVIFGSEDLDGAMTAMKLLLNILLQEGIKGYSKQIILTQYKDDAIEIQTDGRGMYLGSNKEPVWKTLFCELYGGTILGVSTASVFEPHDGEVTDCLELCAVQYASEYMDVCAVRDGFRKRLHFEKGENVGGLSATLCEGPTGTAIRFKLDREVFSDISLPAHQLDCTMQEIALQIPGLKTVFCKETADGMAQSVYFYPNGIKDYLQEHTGTRIPTKIYTSEMTATGQDRYNRPRYTATVKVGLCFSENEGFVKCYHNFRELTYGGTHRDAMLRKLVRYLGWALSCEISEEDLLKHLQLVLVTDCDAYTAWVNGARKGIENVMIRDMAQDIIGDDFQYYIKQNKAALIKLFAQ